MKSVTIVVLAVCLCSAIAAYTPDEHSAETADEVYVVPAVSNAPCVSVAEGKVSVDVSDNVVCCFQLHRFRRQAHRGRVGVEVGHDRNNGPSGRTKNTHARVDASYDFYRSRNGNTRLSGNAYYERNWGSSPSRDTGAGITFRHRF